MATFYTCQDCDNIFVTVGNEAACENAGLVQLKPNSTDADPAKHKPVASVENGKLRITVGTPAHPTEPGHRVEWIYVATSYGGMWCNILPDTEPAVTLEANPDEVEEIYAFCGKHGLWQADSPVLPNDFELNAVSCSPEFTLGCVNPSDEH